ncbi:MFS transporter [Georgenia yuyongxinii]|uniref:MFS transporter n=2 Tax=Georgenia yuyongxinii TaxID=2589797 RepID=A0A552WVP0_9MICO|nr:MFS transporter [Georgenia yuyongxinii]
MIAVAAAAAFLATFNETFLNVALTPIMTDFGVDVSIVQWLATGYLLVAAVFVPVSNVLYHRFATRPLFVAAVAFLVVGSVVGALAPSFGVLLTGRLLQAIGTGLLTPIGMNITLAVAPREKLGLAMGIMAAMTTLGPSMAIVVSGALLSIAPWTTLMWVFGALSLIVLLAGAVLLRNVAELGRPVLDVLSFLLVAVGLVGLLYGISTAFSGPALVAAIAAVVGVLALAAFVMRQNRIEHPLLNLKPFRSTPFVLGVSMTMLGLLFVFAMNVVIPIFLQSVKGQDPLGASLILAPGILMTVVLGPIAGRLFDRHGGRVMIPAGFAIMAAFALLVGVAAGHESVLLFGALYVPAVLATSLGIGPSQTFALSSLDRESSPHGVTVVSTSFQIAGCLGTSLAIGVYNAMTTLGLENGSDLLGASTLGFRGAAVLVALTSVIGVVLAFAATKAARAARAAEAEGTVEFGRARTVVDLMKTDVYALSTEQNVLEALQMFTERGISGAPVLHTDGSLAGFLSDGDVMRYLSAEHPSSTNIYSFAIGESDDLEDALADLVSLPVMRLATREVVTVDANASIADAVAVLSDKHLKKVPVVRGENGPVIGIVSRSAVNRLAISSYLASRAGQVRPADDVTSTAEREPQLA